MKKLIITLILFILILSNKAYSKLPPPGTGTSGVPANILIMLDNSGSMSWDINGNWNSSTKFIDVDFKPKRVLLMIGKRDIMKLTIITDFISKPNHNTIKGATATTGTVCKRIA